MKGPNTPDPLRYSIDSIGRFRRGSPTIAMMWRKIDEKCRKLELGEGSRENIRGAFAAALYAAVAAIEVERASVRNLSEVAEEIENGTL